MRNGRCSPFGPDGGIETTNTAIHYPDTLVNCAAFNLTDRLIPGAIIVFEVLSPTSGRIDRMSKVREYAAVNAIKRNFILESKVIGLISLERPTPDETWRATVVIAGDILRMPKINIKTPITKFYEDVDFRTQAHETEPTWPT